MQLSPDIKALGGRFLPWPEDGIHIRKPDGPPKGLRLSEPCGACCLLDYFQERKNFVSDGVSYEGHLKADAFFQSLVVPVAPVEIEKVYQWSVKGFSGMDGVVDPSGIGLNRHGECGFELQAHYEIKTTSDEGKVKPKLANVEQVIRQRVVMARHYGIDQGEMFPSVIFVIQKGGKRTNWIHGPFLVEPTKEQLEIAQRDIDLRIQVFEDLIEDEEDDPHEHPLLRTMRRGLCTRCFPLERAEAPAEVESVLDRGKKDWDDWKEYERLTKWAKQIKDKMKKVAPVGQQVETEHFLIRHTESGRLYIDIKQLK